jgi:NAD(P)-dependent dehydrogenase (short-subunit alcohol dehydrogenase family)
MVVLITGASSGIGRALASHYLDQGAAVAAVARRAAPLQALHRSDARLAAFTADVTDRARMEAVISEVERILGPIHLAITCAGVAEHEIGPDMMLEGLDLMLATNTVGAFNTLVPAAAAMRARGNGHIVAISSLAALHGIPIMAGYCMSKAALESGMQSLRHALHGSGIGVSVIAPGFIATEMTVGRVAPVFCMPLERAVRRIVSAIERRQPVYRFPLWQHAVVRMLPVLPARAQSSLLERLTQKLRAAPSPQGARLRKERPHHG